MNPHISPKSLTPDGLWHFYYGKCSEAKMSGEGKNLGMWKVEEYLDLDQYRFKQFFVSEWSLSPGKF